jgi:uncharacterized peroxidase-related enzyme
MPPHISPCNPPTAAESAQTVYKEFAAGMGFPAAPNFIRTQGHAPNVARGSWEVVKNILVSGVIPRWIKELMFVAISVERSCMYCAAAHIACCRMLEVNPDWISATAKNELSVIADPKLRDMILFAVKAACTPQTITPSDYSNLRSHGLDEHEIMEIIGMAAFAVYANTIADATAMSSDEIFDSL